MKSLQVTYVIIYFQTFLVEICPGQEGDGAQEPQCNVDTQVVLWVGKLPTGGSEAEGKHPLVLWVFGRR